MRKSVCLMLVVLLVAVSAAQDPWYNESTRPRAGDYLGQACGGCAGGLGIGAVAGVAAVVVATNVFDLGGTTDFGETDAQVNVMWGGFMLCCPLGSAMGAATVGGWQDRDGNMDLAYAWAYAPSALGLLAALVAYVAWPNGEMAQDIFRGTCGATGVLSPIAAVIGYNLDLHTGNEGPPSPLGARLAPPTVAYRTRLGPERQRYSAFDCRLLTVRF